MPANSIVSKRTSCIFSISKLSIAGPSEIEVDHFFHDENAGGHPDSATSEHEAARRMGPQQRNVIRRQDEDGNHNERRQRGDDAGGGFSFHGHRLDFGLHFLALA